MPGPLDDPMLFSGSWLFWEQERIKKPAEPDPVEEQGEGSRRSRVLETEKEEEHGAGLGKSRKEILKRERKASWK